MCIDTHLSGIQFTKLDSTNIELLIGADIQAAHQVYDARRGHDNHPTAVLTDLGWTLVGSDPQLTVGQSDARHVNWLRSEEATDLRKDFHRLYKKEFNDMNYLETASHSVQDKKALSLMEGSVKREENRYQVALPWKSDAIEFPNNHSVAETRLEGLRRRLFKDEGLLDQYKTKMDGYLSAGHARKVPDDQLPATPCTWYVPHHAAKRKFRIVFDYACKFTALL